MQWCFVTTGIVCTLPAEQLFNTSFVSDTGKFGDFSIFDNSLHLFVSQKYIPYSVFFSYIDTLYDIFGWFMWAKKGYIVFCLEANDYLTSEGWLNQAID